MMITDNGTLVRTRVNEVSIIGRNTQGVRLIRTAEDEHVVALQRIDEIEEEDLVEVEAVEGEVVEGEVVEGSESSEQTSDSQDVADSSEELTEGDE